MFFILFLFVSAEALLDLPEGAPCVYDGMNGRCIGVKQCPTTMMIDILQKKKAPEICSFHGIYPIICCTDCEIETKDPNKAVITVDGYLYKTGKSKAWDQCLEHVRRHDYKCKEKFSDFLKEVDPVRNCTYVGTLFKTVVYNGEDAERREFPHMALVGYGDLDSVQWLCGGSIISDRFILTAGHCGRHVEFGPVSYVALGILMRSDPSSYWNNYKVRRFIKHPEYKPPIKYNDIALIETEKQITFSKDILPICLVDTSEVDDSYGVVVGWGALGHRRENADTLQKAGVEKLSVKDCSSLYPVHRHLPDGVRDTQFCYGDSGDDKDTCGGDSGGPLQVTRRETSCVSFVAGVTSYGRECGFKGGAGVYTRVLPYIPWIESVVWP